MSPAHPSAGYLLDTNVLSELMRPAAAQEVLRWFGGAVTSQLHTSAINQAEILAGIGALPAGRRRDALVLAAQEIFEDEFAGRRLAFGSTAAEQFALVTATRKRSGRPIDPVDAQISAIALAARLGLVTRNTRDFESIEGLEVVNPWQPN